MNKLITKEKTFRILSGLIDLLSIFAVSVLLFIGYSKIYLENNENYLNALQTQVQIIEESSLYVKTNKSWVVIEENYDENLTKFYQIYEYDKTSGNSSYESAKEKSGFFVNGVLKNGLEENDEGVREFFSKEMVLALNTLAKNPNYQETAKIVNKLNSIGSDSSIFVASAIFLLILPFFNKRKQSLGKMLFKLETISKHGNKLHWIQLTLKFIVNTIIVIYFSIVMPGIFLLANACFIILSKKGTGIADLFADTYVVPINKEESLEEIVYEEKNGWFRKNWWSCNS